MDRMGQQDPDRGGISDRPNNMVDVFHTHFGVAGLLVHHLMKL